MAVVVYWVGFPSYRFAAPPLLEPLVHVVLARAQGPPAFLPRRDRHRRRPRRRRPQQHLLAIVVAVVAAELVVGSRKCILPCISTDAVNFHHYGKMLYQDYSFC